jgi:orotate phosphoribosyltransferase
MSTLEDLLREHSVKTGDFTLKSGRKSNFYVDVRQTALHAQGSRVIASSILHALGFDRREAGIPAVGGVELGAVPIVGSVIAMAPLTQLGNKTVPLHGFIVRKAPKEHGTQAKIERCPPAGTQVAIIEDVTTTGGSLWAAIQAAQAAGLEVVQAITVVDREEGATEYLAEQGFTGTFTALTTRTELIG